MADVFISYASEDRDQAGRLASALEGRGWSVWWDRHIVAGNAYDQAIEHELNAAKSVVVLWSEHSIASEWVKNEAAVAAERGALVPARIDDVKLPLEFRRKQTTDLVDWDGDPTHEGFQALCNGIASRIGGTGSTPLPPITPPAFRFAWNRCRTVAAIAAIGIAFGFGAYWGWGALRQSSSSSVPGESIKSLRSVPAVLSHDEVNAMLVRHGFYDQDLNAGGKGIRHDYEAQVIASKVVVLDHATGLMWQKGGSETMALADADSYIGRLNTARFAGFADWRLPTVEEAMSLMEPQAHDELHVDPVFQKGINFIWTADLTPAGRGWVLYFYNGFLRSEPVEFNAWIRAVRSAAARRE